MTDDSMFAYKKHKNNTYNTINFHSRPANKQDSKQSLDQYMKKNMSIN